MIQAEALLRASLATAQNLLQTATTEDETETGQRGVAVTQSSLADLLTNRGQYDEAERLYRLSLPVKEELGDRRSVAVTQSSLADLLRVRGQYDEAERLYQSGLAICRTIPDPQGAAVFLRGLGHLALARGRREEAVSLLRQARPGFEALGLLNWAASVDEVLAEAQDQGLTLAALARLIQAARQGDHQAGEQAWELCNQLAQDLDETLAALGRGLQQLLAGLPPETALAGLPDDLRRQILAGLAE
jgi:tetratricopeptide (TPR) repeat protein